MKVSMYSNYDTVPNTDLYGSDIHDEIAAYITAHEAYPTTIIAGYMAAFKISQFAGAMPGLDHILAFQTPFGRLGVQVLKTGDSDFWEIK